MELRHLKVLLAVAEAGSISKAAAMLSVAQPMLSRQIKALEAEVGTELFLRNGRGVVLTEAGRLLATRAEFAVNTIDRAADELRALQEVPTGQVVIGVPPTVGTVLTLPLVREFRAEFPKVALRVVEGFSGYVLEWLSVGRVDVAVIYDAPKSSTLLTEHLHDEEIYLIGSAKPYPDDLPDGAVLNGSSVSRLPLILPSPRHGLRILLDNIFARHRLVPWVDVEADSLPSILALVEDGIGYTVLPYAPVHHLLEAGRMRHWRIEKPSISRRLVLATSTSRTTTPATRALTKMVREQVRTLVKSGRWSPHSPVVGGHSI